MDDTYGFVDDAPATERVGRILDDLCPTMGLDTAALSIRFLGTSKVTRPRVLAAAAFGGHVYIEEAWLHAVPPPSDDELAFVLAHELGHVRARHAELALVEQASPGYASIGELKTTNPRVRFLAEQARRARESKPRETEADEAAIDALLRTRRSTHGMEELFDRVARFDRRSGSIADSLLYDHASAEERRTHLRNWIRDTRKGTPR